MLSRRDCHEDLTSRPDVVLWNSRLFELLKRDIGLSLIDFDSAFKVMGRKARKWP